MICILQSKTMKKKAKIFTIFVEVDIGHCWEKISALPLIPPAMQDTLVIDLIGQLSHNVIGRLSVISQDVIGYEDSS